MLAKPIEFDTNLRYTTRARSVSGAETPEVGAPIKITLTPLEVTLRHAKQLFATATPAPGDDEEATGASADLPLTPIASSEFPHMLGQPLFSINEPYRCFNVTDSATGEPVAVRSFNDKALIQPQIYLFNIIIAAEWTPSRDTIQLLMETFKSASDFLYDASNGYMAIGQVIFAGKDLMSQADIQLLASSRFHPRSWVNGLNDPKKFSPVRIGRGIWDKNNSVIMPWNEPAGFRTLVHEWGHYALSLRDEYFDEDCEVVSGAGESHHYVAYRRSSQRLATIVVPRVSLSLGSIMAALDASEIVPYQQKVAGDVLDHLLNQFRTLYPHADIVSNTNAGPRSLPVSLPQFYSTDGLQCNASDTLAEEWSINVNALDLDHCWLYALGWDAAGHLVRAIPQGSIDARARDVDGVSIGSGFSVLGADRAAVDEQAGRAAVLAIGFDRTTAQPTCMLYTSGTPENPQDYSWKAAPLPATPPAVSVISTEDGSDPLSWPDFPVKVRVVGDLMPQRAWIALPGEAPRLIELTAIAPNCWESAPYTAAHLDGLVVLQWGTGAQASFWVAEYSHGGSPPTTVRKPSPISAGSSDGNLMIFCRTENDPDELKKYQDIRIVTARNYAGFGGAPTSIGARSYMFSLSSNKRIPKDTLRTSADRSPGAADDLHATIIMYYDGDAIDQDGDLAIYRYDMQQGWIELTTFAPPGALYAALPVDDITAPSLVSSATDLAGDRIEYYRLFLKPRS